MTREKIARIIFDRACGASRWNDPFYILEQDGCYETADAILAALEVHKRAGFEHVRTLTDDEVIVVHPQHPPAIYNFKTGAGTMLDGRIAAAPPS